MEFIICLKIYKMLKKKLENKNYFCKFYACNYILFDVYDRESTYIFLAILDYI